MKSPDMSVYWCVYIYIYILHPMNVKYTKVSQITCLSTNIDMDTSPFLDNCPKGTFHFPHLCKRLPQAKSTKYHYIYLHHLHPQVLMVNPLNPIVSFQPIPMKSLEIPMFLTEITIVLWFSYGFPLWVHAKMGPLADPRWSHRPANFVAGPPRWTALSCAFSKGFCLPA